MMSLLFKLLLSGALAATLPSASDQAARDALRQRIADDAKLPADQVRADPSAADFPGLAPADAPRVTRTISIDPKVPGWHSTGLYANAGEVISVLVPSDVRELKLKLQIGSHTDKLWNAKEWKRFPQIVRTWPLNDARPQFASSFGELIYIDVPPDAPGGPFTLEIAQAVEAPLFVLGQTSLEEWKSIRNRPAPWAEIASDKIILTLPSKHVRMLDDPESLMKFWDRAADADADLATIPHQRARPERYVADVQISAGYMHSGYPIMTHLDAAARMVDLARLQTKGDWGMFHELGHNHQNGDWTFAGSGEVTVNLFTLYDLETLCPGAPLHESIQPAARAKRREKYFANGANFDEWKADPFLALSMYYDLKEAFGWDTYKRVFAEYRTLPKNQRPRNDDEKRDQWMVRFSRACGKNLGPFFEMWGVPTSDAARQSIADLPVWMPAYAEKQS